MKRAITSLSVCVALLFASCIDLGFNLADTSGEVTIGGEELVVPLAEIGPIRLGDIVEESEYLNSGGEDGTYQFSFSSYGEDPSKFESVSIQGISIPNITGLSPKLEPITFSFSSLPTSLLFSAIEKSIPVDFPATIGQIVDIEAIKVSQPIEFALPSQISGQGVIDDKTLSLLNMLQLSTISTSGENEMVFDASLEILEQLKQVNWVEFGCEDHPYGAPFSLRFDLNGMKGIVSGGNFKFNITFPEGYYIRDEYGNDLPVATHNIFSKEVNLAVGQRYIDVLLYLNKIDYSDHQFTNGKLEINDHISYKYDISVNLGKGEYNLNSKPLLTVEAAPKYKDVEVKINHFDIPKQEQAITHSFNGMPSGVVVEKVASSKSSNLTVSLKGLEWCVVQDNLTDEDISPKIEIAMPRCMHFREHPLLDAQTNEILATATDLARGITLSLDYIDCKNSEGVKQENGQLLINEKISAAIHMESLDGHTILVSSITPPDNLAVVMSVAESLLEIDTANSVVTWSDSQSFDFDLNDNMPYISQSIEVPEMIAKVERIEIGKANSSEPFSMTFKLDAGNQFPIPTLAVDVAINLGKLLRPTQKMIDDAVVVVNNNGDYILTINEEWKPNQTALVKRLEFEALENIPAVENGKITINQTFPVTGSVKIKSGENIDLSVNNAKINIDVNIDDIEVRTFTGALNVSIAPEEMVVKLGDFSNLGVNISNLSLNPILDIKLKDNPTNIPLSGNISIKTLDNEGNTKSALSIPTINIAGSGPTHLVLSTPRNAAKYEGVEGVTFLAVEGLSELLADGIPSEIAVKLAVQTDKNDIRTIDLLRAKEGYNIEYQYSVVMPLELGGDTDLSYESTVLGLNGTFAELADTTNGLKVGDIGLVAEFGTTIPLNIVLSAELVNAEGTSEGVEARLDINNCLIKGYTNEAECGEKRVSKIDLDFNLGDSHSLEGLRNADGIRFKFTLYGTGENAALKKTQFIDGKLKLRLRNGLTIDIFDFLKGNENEE